MPGLIQKLIFHIVALSIMCKPGKNPSLVITMQASSCPDGKHRWSGKVYMTFGRDEYWDAKAGELVAFFHSVLGLKLANSPNWEAMSQRIGNFRFFGRLQVNKKGFFNLISIQRVGAEVTWDEKTNSQPINAWTTDKKLFSDDINDPVLISEEVYLNRIFGPGQSFDAVVAAADAAAAAAGAAEDDPTLEDFEDEIPVPHALPPKKKKVHVVDINDLV